MADGKWITGLTPEMPADEAAELHQLRITAKRLRYAMEVFVGCCAPPMREVLYPAVEEAQEILGGVQDAAVAASRLEQIEGELRYLPGEATDRLRPGVATLADDVRSQAARGAGVSAVGGAVAAADRGTPAAGDDARDGLSRPASDSGRRSAELVYQRLDHQHELHLAVDLVIRLGARLQQVREVVRADPLGESAELVSPRSARRRSRPRPPAAARTAVRPSAAARPATPARAGPRTPCPPPRRTAPRRPRTRPGPASPR